MVQGSVRRRGGGQSESWTRDAGVVMRRQGGEVDGASRCFSVPADHKLSVGLVDTVNFGIHASGPHPYFNLVLSDRGPSIMS
jgi:hypothetical protein